MWLGVPHIEERPYYGKWEFSSVVCQRKTASEHGCQEAAITTPRASRNWPKPEDLTGVQVQFSPTLLIRTDQSRDEVVMLRLWIDSHLFLPQSDGWNVDGSPALAQLVRDPQTFTMC